MASIVDKLPFRVRRRRGDYPWEAWLDGNTRVMVRGEDFECGVLSFQQMVSKAGRARGVRVLTQVDGERVYVQAVKT